MLSEHSSEILDSDRHLGSTFTRISNPIPVHLEIVQIPTRLTGHAASGLTTKLTHIGRNGHAKCADKTILLNKAS